MLSQEQYELLAWLRDQGQPVSMREMERRQAPGFTSQRVESMRKAGLIDRSMGAEDGELVAVYTISDKGRATLSEFEEKRRQQAQQKRQQRFDNKIAVAQVLVPFITFLLGLVVEHFAGIVAWVLSRFG